MSSGYTKNPKTGELIKILQLETSLWRDQKTLVWLDDVPTEPAATPNQWMRWDIGATSIAAAERLAAAGLEPSLVACLDDDATVKQWLQAGAWSKYHLIAVRKSFVDWMGIEELVKLKVTNMLCLDEVAQLYPYTGPVWDGTTEDAKICIALALRFGRSFPIAPTTYRVSLAAQRGLRCEAELQAPPQLIWITQAYTPSKARRAREIQACLKALEESPVIDKLVLLNESASTTAPTSPQAEQHIVGRRLHYSDVIRWIRDEAPPNALVAFANSDIVPDADSFRALWSVDLLSKPRFLALLRWETESLSDEHRAAAQLFGPRADSQDTWIVGARQVQEGGFADLTPFEFPFGQAGCDNALTLEMLRKKFAVANPALTLKTYHYHSSQVRTYDPLDVVAKPAYLYISPSGLHDMEPRIQLKASRSITPASFDRPVRGPLSAAQARTFCTMVARATEQQVLLDPIGPNTWQPPKTPLYELQDAFQSRDGLVFTYDSILVGPTKASAKAWSESQLSSMAASVSADTAVAVPLSNSVATNPTEFVLSYLAKVLYTQKVMGWDTSEFWCSRVKPIAEALSAFRWPSREVPVLSRDENQQAWCKKIVAWMPQDGATGLVSREEIQALREAFGFGGVAWAAEPDAGQKRVVLVVDGVWLTDEVADELELALESDSLTTKIVWAGRTSLEPLLRSLRGAWGIVVADRQLAGWSWVLPKAARIWEIQSEMEPRADILHMAAAAEQEHRLLITPKGQPTAADREAMVKKLVTDIKAAAGAAPAAEPVAQAAPRSPPPLIMPTGHKGFFAHAGDSFRELARMWAERGYVTIQESATAHNCWLGAVGETLLYDRPTLEWLRKSPAVEQTWTRAALFGNPEPPSKGSSWFFWPRRPRLVEDAVTAGIGSSSFETRKHNLVFYGRSENAVQHARRHKADWSKVCDDFYHIEGSTEYPFSPQEYLKRLANAKFGLCLAGYGRKCHREVECMAMGCVPIVASEVDMENYYEPPQVGVHYLRVENPEEVKHILATLTPERWTAMSAACRDWWRRNASAEGSWRLTERLAAAKT